MKLDYNAIGNSGVNCLSGLSNMRILNLGKFCSTKDRNNIGDKAAKLISKMKDLRELYLCKTLLMKGETILVSKE